MFKEGLDLGLLALSHQQTNQRSARTGILGVHIDGVLELLFRFGRAVTRLVKAAQGQLRIHCLRTCISSLLKVGLSLVGKIGAQLQQCQIEVRLGAIGIGSNPLLHFLHGRAQVILGGVKVCPSLMRIRTVGLFFAQDIQVNLSLLQVSCGDKQVGQVHMRGVVVGSQLDSAGKFLVGTIEVSKLEIGFRELIVGLRETGIDLHSIGKLNGARRSQNTSVCAHWDHASSP